MRLLDLFCGAGGAAMGYHRAGFDEIVGVDIKPQPNYPFEFVQMDALDALKDLLARGLSVPGQGSIPGSGLHFVISDFGAVHASPPCQGFSDLKVMWNAGEYEDLLTPTRDLLIQVDLPWVIENVEGAPMPDRVRLCGGSFGLKSSEGYHLRRHRLFETSFPIMVPPCVHPKGIVVGFYGDHARLRRRSAEGGDITKLADKMRLVKETMDIDWMTWDEARQAIPPAYTQYIGHVLLSQLARESA